MADFFLLLGLLLALAYLGLIHRAAWQARARRRHGQAERLAARIFAPHQPGPPGGELRALLRDLVGIATDQPRALPLAAAILAGGLLLLLALDPILDDPILWGARVPPSWRAALPAWLKLGWVLAVVALVLGHCVWIFGEAPRRLSRHWLLLHPDGGISAEGADLPRIDPLRPRQSLDRIPIPARRQDGLDLPAGEAEGAVLEQDGRTIGFVANPHVPRPGSLRRLAETPPEWWRVELEPDHASFHAFLLRHHPPRTPPA
ncbi:hypothetical protein [Falsiroseomonas sp. E2-1-a20]|uniref:hypothetical protein n=1 Tax=Falsiroseomonas sp. E2-1-a20 TaxID=3239300 RepID=UPI003F39F277